MADDRMALAAITARALAEVLRVAAARLPLVQADGLAIGRTVYTVSALMAPAIETAADVAAIGTTLAAAAATVRASAAAPQDASPVLYAAASAAAAAVPSFRSPARQRAAALARVLAECLEATWLGEAFVAEALTGFGDRQAATAARARISAAMDGAIDRMAAANIGMALLDLVGSVARTSSAHIATVAADLQPIIRVQTQRSAPSTAIAFGLYGDPSRAVDLVTRNRCGTPLFMPTTLDALAPDA